MDDDQQFCLRWNNHQSTLISVFDTLLENETLVDCTLAAEGKFLKAHKVVLSACSPYFATLLQEQYDKHPIFILKDVKYQELRAMMDYMYRGEVNISQDQLAALLKAAESLQIKGLSDNRSGGSGSGSGTAAAAAAAAAQATKPESHHRVKLSGPYTLEQTKRARITAGGQSAPGAMVDAGDISGSREGSSSPSRRRRKIRRRSMENDMHDNSNSSVLQTASNQSILQQTSAGLAASALVSTQLASGSGNAGAAAVAAATGSISSSQISNQPLTSSSSNVTKKTDSAKLSSTAAAAQVAQQQQQQQQQNTSDAINTDNVQQQQQGGAQGDADDMDNSNAGGGAIAIHTGGVVKQLATLDKSNHKQKIKDNNITASGTTATSASSTEMVIEPKAEYDDDTHDENVEDLTLDEEDIGMEELDQAAGTSQGGEGSSQPYAWQHDRSQDELGLMATQDAQQRDPQEIKFEFGGHSVFGNDSKSDRDDPNERFPCAVCGKSYLRKRHLQRHMRDECIGIPPRFNCEFCSSRFRRKYHMVRHLISKHGVPPAIAQQTTGSGSRTSSPRSAGNNNLELKMEVIAAAAAAAAASGGGATGAGTAAATSGHGAVGIFHSDSASVGSAGSHNGCESPIPENLSLRKEEHHHHHYERDENINNDDSRCTSPLPPHMMPIPTYGLTGAITAISAAAAVVEEQAAAAAAAAAAAELATGGGNNIDEADGDVIVKPEPVTPGKTQTHTLLDEEWNMKLGLQIISNSLLKERLMNTMPFAYNNN